MKRREFLKSSLAVTGVAGLASALETAAADKGEPDTREYYELRLYHLRRGPKQKLFDDFYREASIPAMNRAGLRPIGVFNVAYGPDNPTMYVLIPHNTIESFGSALDRVPFGRRVPESRGGVCECAGGRPIVYARGEFVTGGLRGHAENGGARRHRGE
jgi:hypothetical protein